MSYITTTIWVDDDVVAESPSGLVRAVLRPDEDAPELDGDHLPILVRRGHGRDLSEGCSGADWYYPNDAASGSDENDFARAVDHFVVQEVRECYASGRLAKAVVTDPRTGSAVLVEPEHGRVAVAPQPTRAAPAGEGWFSMGGKIYKVQQSQSSGHLYAKVLETTGGWVFAPGKIKELTEDHRLTAAEAAKYGKLYGVCCICGRVLTNEESIEAGIGPICAGRIS